MSVKEMKVKKAIIPAAGFGTRLLPATKSQPKEMLIVYDKPVIQHVVEEIVSSGIDDILIITGRGKRAIEDHFDNNPEIEMILKNSGKEKELKQIQEISDLATIHYIRQKEQKGLGNAVSYAETFAGGEPFALLLGDTITVPSCTTQLLEAFDKYNNSLVAVERVPREKISRYGIVDAGADCRIMGLVEKPRPENAPSNLAILGRYIFTPEIFDCIKETAPGYGGEIQLTDAMKSMLGKQRIHAIEYRGKRYDIGSRLDLLKSSVEFAMNSNDGNETREYLKQLKNIMA